MRTLSLACAVGLWCVACGNDDGSQSAALTPAGGSGNGNVAGAAVSGGSSSGGGSAPSSGGSINGGSSSNEAGKPSGGTPVMPPPMVNDCNGLAEPGVFEEITPAEVKIAIGQKAPDGQVKGGPFAMAVDPVNQGTVYSGTLLQGVWKTTDCGSTWTKLDSGMNGADVNRGMNWTFEVDPFAPDTVYTNSGYGSNGLFKSTDGGKNWTDIWSAASQPELGKAFQYNFANTIALDPEDGRHLLLTFHEGCLPPNPSTCIVESFDAGGSWKVIGGKEGWNGGEGQVIFFLDTPTTWLWGSQNNGFWRTPDSGKTWEQVPKMATSHLQGTRLLHAKDGSFYVPAGDGVWRSPDGKADTWTLIEGTGPISGSIVSDGTNMYTSTCYAGGFCDQARYLTSPESDGKSWTELPNVPKIPMGGNLGYDSGHKLLFSSNLTSGLWRVRVP
ncbi:MAG: hypothetical protein EOO73_22225 [Myxococcales bacterium]|nr:MAG: hypothetical protein EOO73_22225 [Myxococcales bacterium]